MADPIPLNVSMRLRTLRELADGIKEWVNAGSVQCAVVIGFDSDGDLFVRSSRVDRGTSLWLIEAAKQHILTDHTNLGIGPERGEPDERSIIQIGFIGDKNAEQEQEASPPDGGSST